MESDSISQTAGRAPDQDVDRVLNRLRRIEGQVRGLHRMVEEGKPCESVLTQLAAVKSALDRVGIHLISHRMKECLQPDGTGDEARMENAFEVFLRYRQGAGGLPEDGLMSGDEEDMSSAQRVLAYLRWIEGNVRDLIRTIEVGADCEAVLSDLGVVKAALDRVGIFLISHRMKECIERGSADALDDPIERALDVFLKYAASAR